LPGAGLAEDRHRGRRHCRPVLGDPGDADGAAADLLFHVARRPAAAGVRQGPPAPPHPAHQHDHRRRGRLRTGRPDAAERAGRAGVDGHPAGLRHRVRRRAGPASHPAGPSAPVPGPDGGADLPAGRAGLPVPVLAALRRTLADLRGLDAVRPGGVLRLRLSPQPPAHRLQGPWVAIATGVLRRTRRSRRRHRRNAPRAAVVPCARIRAMSALPYNADAFERCAAELVANVRELAARGWTPATSSNFSMRMDDRHVAITASGGDKGRLTSDGLMVVDLDGAPVGTDRRPSAETLLHTRLYRRFPEVGCVLHTHSHNQTVASRLFAGAGQVHLQGYELLKAFAGNSTHDTEVD